MSALAPNAVFTRAAYSLSGPKGLKCPSDNLAQGDSHARLVAYGGPDSSRNLFSDLSRSVQQIVGVDHAICSLTNGVSDTSEQRRRTCSALTRLALIDVDAARFNVTAM